jgi:alpha-galactosidase
VLQPVEGWRIRPVLWNFKGLTDEQARSHLTLWAMLAAPLLASHDLASTERFDLDLLRNPEILAIDQDPLGQQARRRRSERRTWVLAKPLADGRLALSVTNLARRTRTVDLDLAALGLARSAEVLDAWSMAELGHLTSITARLPAHGSAVYVCRPALRPGPGLDNPSTMVEAEGQRPGGGPS